MNVLPFVIAILMILSYSAAGLLQKHIGAAHAQKAYMGLQRAERSVLQKAERNSFKAIDGELVKCARAEREPAARKPHVAVVPQVNDACARLNLFPLALEGRERHPVLYDAAAKLLRTFYREKLFNGQEDLELTLLDALLAAAKKRIEKESSVSLPTLRLGDPALQRLYYLALKGTKRADVPAGVGYPPLLEALKIERGESQVCLYHAHPNMLAALFNPKVAVKLFQDLHAENGGPVGIAGLQPLVEPKAPDFWKLFDYLGPKGGGHCKNAGTTTIVGEDEVSGVVVRHEMGKR